jgi:branched-chain amino acid transport system substrate-binding protein
VDHRVHPSYATEAAIYADYLKNQTDAKTVAILFQNDDFGKDYVDSFKKAAGGDIEVVAEESYEATDPAVDTQITNLADSDADAFLGATTALKCPQVMDAIAQSGWDPIAYISQTCTSPILVGLARPESTDGLLSTSYLMDPRDPQWDDNENMQLFKEKVVQYGENADPQEGLQAYGWTMGALAAHVLEEAPKLTRLDVMVTARQLRGVEVGAILPGVKFSTDKGDPFPVEAMQVIRYSGDKQLWELLDENGQVLPEGEVKLLDFEGETSKFAA